MVICKACKKKMHNHDFQTHDCPAIAQPKDGESWEDYKARSDAHSKKWREKNGVK